MVKPIPDGFHTVTPHLVVKNAKAALDFYAKAFGAEQTVCMSGPDGKSVMHAEMRIGNSVVMLAEDFNYPNAPRAPENIGGTCVGINLYVEDCDASYKRAVDAGATALMPPMDMFWGDRYGKLKDPYGHQWAIMTHIEDVPPEEMGKRMAEAMKNMGDCDS